MTAGSDILHPDLRTWIPRLNGCGAQQTNPESNNLHVWIYTNKNVQRDLIGTSRNAYFHILSELVEWELHVFSHRPRSLRGWSQRNVQRLFQFIQSFEHVVNLGINSSWQAPRYKKGPSWLTQHTPAANVFSLWFETGKENRFEDGMLIGKSSICHRKHTLVIGNNLV